MRLTWVFFNTCVLFYLGFPIALSYPHFYKADPSLIEAIDGVKPNQQRHETYFLINPVRLVPIIV